MKILKVGYPAEWGSLLPALQHTAYADQILANEFETLVREGSGGSILPLLATSWEVNDNFTKYRFHLDTSRVFSNGQKLNSSVVKRAWEYGLSLPARSSNSSLQDVLYLVEGYPDFTKAGSLPGLKIIDDSTIEIEFMKPFRTALSEFGTSRMAVFIHENERAFGTGAYIIRERGSNQSLVLERNPYYRGSVSFDSVEIVVIPPERMKEALEKGKIDLYAFADAAPCLSDDTATCFTGVESEHQIIVVNGLKGRLFENPRLRLALQYLIANNINATDLPPNYKGSLALDPQPYLSLQQGRISELEAHQIIESGAKYVDELIRNTNLRPLYLVTSELTNWVQECLSREGVVFDPRSGIIDLKTRMQMYYKTFEPDLIVAAASVASGDPDGLFHLLAKDGSIASPMSFRLGVSKDLEAGRAILNVGTLDRHYKNVTRRVLNEVPFVHVGFIKGVFAYNKARIRVRTKLREQDRNEFAMFEPI